MTSQIPRTTPALARMLERLATFVPTRIRLAPLALSIFAEGDWAITHRRLRVGDDWTPAPFAGGMVMTMLQEETEARDWHSAMRRLSYQPHPYGYTVSPDWDRTEYEGLGASPAEAYLYAFCSALGLAPEQADTQTQVGAPGETAQVHFDFYVGQGDGVRGTWTTERLTRSVPGRNEQAITPEQTEQVRRELVELLIQRNVLPDFVLIGSQTLSRNT